MLIVLMIVRFDKNYQFGPVGDSGVSGIGESNFLATAKATLDKITSMGGGSGGGMGDGDFLGMVSLSMLSTMFAQLSFCRESLSAMPSSSPAFSSTTSSAAASPSWSSS